MIGAGLLVWVGRRQTERQAGRLGRILGAVTALIYSAILIYVLTPPTIESSVPLQLTDLATVVAAYALWSQKHWAYALTYYWGLVLSAQALVSPALQSPDFPHYQFLAFWAIHLLVVWAAIYLTWGRGMPRSTGSQEPTTDSSTGNLPPPLCWMCWARGRGTYSPRPPWY